MERKNSLQVREPNAGEVTLHNNGLRAGSLIDQSLSRLNKDQAQNLMAKAAEEALRLEVKNREQNMDYVTGKKAVEDHIDTYGMLDKSGKMTRHTVISDVKTGAGNMRIESKSGATCFVASVAYDDPNHPDVMYLRSYRDAVLTKTPRGRRFISWYWSNGPKIAAVVKNSKTMIFVARHLIGGIVFGLKKTTGRP